VFPDSRGDDLDGIVSDDDPVMARVATRAVSAAASSPTPASTEVSVEEPAHNPDRTGSDPDGFRFATDLFHRDDISEDELAQLTAICRGSADSMARTAALRVAGRHHRSDSRVVESARLVASRAIDPAGVRVACDLSSDAEFDVLGGEEVLRLGIARTLRYDYLCEIFVATVEKRGVVTPKLCAAVLGVVGANPPASPSDGVDLSAAARRCLRTMLSTPRDATTREWVEALTLADRNLVSNCVRGQDEDVGPERD